MTDAQLGVGWELKPGPRELVDIPVCLLMMEMEMMEMMRVMNVDGGGNTPEKKKKKK